ncbi:uncharacterized protein Meltrin isoform X1 [Venturia canescens]|uniref:uncharacterized protein Meltrin isoform X1 n=1 Tax=Venturia canescens TaxID=32260 RepID=UPI001C9D46C2|nr:uncharacterized protein LOC122408113 isoform X1 [Venturia canescens]
MGLEWRRKVVQRKTIFRTNENVIDSMKKGPSEEFSSHTVVRPKVYHARSKRAIFNTKENDDPRHTDMLTVGFEVDGVERTLDLRLNTDLIPVNYKQRHQHQGGYITETPQSVELCHYQGSVRGIPDSWVAVSTCKGLKGVVFDGRELHHIQPDKESLDDIHYVYKQSDLITNNTCGYEGTPHQVIEPFLEPRAHRTSRYKRAADTVIRGPYNANRQSRYVELVLVIDKKEYVALGENLDKVHHHCKDIANIINALYTPLNIFVALVGVEVWTDSDEMTLSPKGDTTLRNFLNYRREMLVKEIPNDNAQLLTKVHFEDGVVGKALKGPICTYEFSGGVSMDHSNVIGLVAATMAHEMGHNFGMEHDSADCTCPEDRCIMAPSSGSTGPVHWSSCSLEYLARAFEHGMDYCLRNKPQKLFDSPICGNGFVEPGEQCDCGLKENCDNPCCNATTCMLHTNASCATGECCDLRTCRPKNAGTECRSAEHECDLPEYCTGQSEYCPGDVFKIDGETCNMGKAFCYQGSCRTHNDQCKLLWGPTGSSSDVQCYDMNNNGSKFGNCGYNRLEESFVKCHNENILCGMLHCKHLNERLEFGMETVAILSQSFINNGGKIIACRSAMVDLGLNQVDPGLAPDGAKCAPGKMCVNQKCMPIADLRKSITGRTGCPNDCGGNGVCNSLGHCHCNRGFHPPDCVQPGFGGSDDSGPAEDPNARNDFITALYIIFLGVIPMMALISLGVWYAKNNSSRHWKKEAISTKDRGNSGFAIKTIDRPMPRSIDTIDSTLSQDPACASLLPKKEPDERFNNNLFGQFKGFTLSALPSATNKIAEPTKPAPPPPNLPTVAIKTNIRSQQRSNTMGLQNAFMNDSAPLNHHIHQHQQHQYMNKDPAPALPPLNPGCTARPLISSPVLAATTCTSMELLAAKMPTRPAPDIPVRPSPESTVASTGVQKPPRPNSTPLVNVVITELDNKPQIPQEKQTTSTLNRIASMLKPAVGIIRSNSQPQSIKEDKNTNSLPRSQHQKAIKVIDKEILRNLEISHPIPQKNIEIPSSVISVIANETNADKRPVVMRAQSMRDPKVSTRPAIHTFGSMRQANPSKRPTSIPASARPTSPPPVPPTSSNNSDKSSESLNKIPGLPGYQNPPVKIVAKPTDDAYDDCMNLVAETALTKIMEESPSNDNIYAVIEESIPEKMRKKTEPRTPGPMSEYKAPKPIDKPSDQTAPPNSDGMGLLSEIVSEISNRNFDSIYSTSTLARKKKEKEEAEKNLNNLGSNSSINTYANSSNHYKSPGSVYSNSVAGKFNSASSTTSSGYLNPSSLNVPERANENSGNIEGSPTKKIDENKLASLHSNNPNVNDAMSKALGMKPPESIAPSKPPTNILERSVSTVNSKKNEDKKEEKLKSTSNRTKTPANIGKTTSLMTKQSSDSDAKLTRQSSDTVSKLLTKQNVEASANVKPSSRQGSDSSLKTSRQGSDTSLKSSSNKVSSPTRSNGSSNKSSSNSEKRDSISSLNSVASKNSLSSAITSKDNPGKINNIPDLNASCSAANPNASKILPDVTFGSNMKNNAAKITQKATSTTTRLPNKTPSMPPKPGSILTKAATFAERKKSPTTPTSPNTALTKSLSLAAKDSIAKSLVLQINKTAPQKSDGKTNETRTNPVQKAAGSKSNVASLQQKFETNKISNPGRTVSAVNKKLNFGKTENTNSNNATNK